MWYSWHVLSRPYHLRTGAECRARSSGDAHPSPEQTGTRRLGYHRYQTGEVLGRWFSPSSPACTERGRDPRKLITPGGITDPVTLSCEP